MSDLISRLSDLRSQYSFFNESEREVYHTLSEAIEALQEQKTGWWIHGVYTSGTEYRRCTNCFAEIEEVFFGFEYAVNYCPHCGCKMEGTE